jgi:hypothetical protein
MDGSKAVEDHNGDWVGGLLGLAAIGVGVLGWWGLMHGWFWHEHSQTVAERIAEETSQAEDRWAYEFGRLAQPAIEARGYICKKATVIGGTSSSPSVEIGCGFNSQQYRVTVDSHGTITGVNPL